MRWPRRCDQVAASALGRLSQVKPAVKSAVLVFSAPVAALLLHGLAEAAPAAPSPLVVPFDFSRGAIDLEVKVHGQPLRMILDTGVDPSVIDLSRAQALGLKIDDADLEAVAGVVGADGPMCLRMRTAWAEGRGDLLTDEPRLPPLSAVLFNPGVPSPTGAVYRAYDAGSGAAADRPDTPGDWSTTAVIDWLSRQRNDLEAPAIALTPDIAEALHAVAATAEVALTRMSGSGATVFGLYPTDAAAQTAAAALAAQHPNAWVRFTRLSVQ